MACIEVYTKISIRGNGEIPPQLELWLSYGRQEQCIKRVSLSSLPSNTVHELCKFRNYVIQNNFFNVDETFDWSSVNDPVIAHSHVEKTSKIPSSSSESKQKGKNSSTAMGSLNDFMKKVAKSIHHKFDPKVGVLIPRKKRKPKQKSSIPIYNFVQGLLIRSKKIRGFLRKGTPEYHAVKNNMDELTEEEEKFIRAHQDKKFSDFSLEENRTLRQCLQKLSKDLPPIYEQASTQRMMLPKDLQMKRDRERKKQKLQQQKQQEQPKHSPQNMNVDDDKEEEEKNDNGMSAEIIDENARDEVPVTIRTLDDDCIRI